MNEEFEKAVIEEIQKYKWIESEKAGRDLGEAAIEDWNSRHWWGWCRSKWLEHLKGTTYWTEFGDRDYGTLSPERWEDPQLLETVVGMVEEGRENLDILTWAVHTRADLGKVLDILEIVDVNTVREHPSPSAHKPHARHA